VPVKVWHAVMICFSFPSFFALCGEVVIFRTMFKYVSVSYLLTVNIQHFSFAYIFIWVRKLGSDSLTETKN